MRWLIALGIVGVVVLITPCRSDAETPAKHSFSLTKEYTPSAWTAQTGYGRRALGKLGFGVKNILLGWTELFTESHEAVIAGENVVYGVAKGVLYAVLDELGGIVHVATFPITGVDVPLPDGGTHVLSF
jgi:hypothetical protein